MKFGIEQEVIVLGGEESASELAASQEVLELRQKVAKMEKDFQGAIRIAGEAQTRVEYLENLLDKKPSTLGNMNENLVEELHTRLSESSAQLEEARKESARREERQQERIDELERKIAEYECGQLLQPEQQVILPLAATSGDMMEEIDVSVFIPLDSSFANVHGANHSTNIFELCPAGTPDSISFKWAKVRLYSKFIDGQKKKMWRLGDLFKDEALDCGVCKKKFKHTALIYHFFSVAHANKVTADCENTAVPLSAFMYWMRKLESISMPV